MTTISADTGDWPIELRFLALSLRHALGTAQNPEPPAPGFDWDTWLTWVSRHKVGGFLHRRLPQAARDLLPSAAALRLRDAGMATAQRALAMTGELVRLTSLFEKQGIRVIGLKGPLIAQQLYHEAGVRHAGDIDLLVAPGDIAAADLLLKNSGYSRSYPDFDPTPLQWRHFLAIEHELNHFHPQTGLRVELQWRLEGLPDISFDQLWISRSSVALAGRNVAALPPYVSELFLFAHGAKHGWASLFWLLDVALVLHRCDEQKAASLWTEALRMAAAKPLLQGALLAHQLLETELPAILSTNLQRHDVRALTTEAMRRMRQPSMPQASMPDLMRDTAYLFRLRETWRERWRFVRRRLSSPQNWIEFPLPDRWFWLYYPASPFLWAGRQLRNRRRAPGGNPPPVHPRIP